MAMSVISAPAVEVLDADDAVLRQHLRLEDDETEQNAVISAFAASARAKAEAFMHRALITQTVRFTLDGFRDAIELEVAPLQEVAQVTYLDAAGDWQTVDPADYQLITSRVPFELHPAYGTCWPTPRLDAASVQVDVVVGYGDDASAVPADILQAIRLLTAHFYYHREASSDGIEELPMGVRDLLMPHVFWV